MDTRSCSQRENNEGSAGWGAWSRIVGADMDGRNLIDAPLALAELERAAEEIYTAV